MRINPRLGVTVTGVITTKGHTERPVFVAINPESSANARILTIGHDEVLSAQLKGFARLVLHEHARAVSQLTIDTRRLVEDVDGFTAGEQGGAVAHGALGNQTVKIEAGDGVAVVWKIRDIGPLHFE